MDDINQKLAQLIEEQKQELMKTLNKYGTLHPQFGREHVPEEITPDKLAEVDELAKKLAKSQLESGLIESKKEHPRFTSTEETVRNVERPSKTNLASQLDEAGVQGSILKKKLLEAGIDANKIKDVSELAPIRSKPDIIPMDERARIIDVGALKAEANKAALQKLGKVSKIGAGLGALATAADIKEGNIPEAGIDIAETLAGLGVAGPAGRFAPALELLRPTEMEPKDNITSDIPMRPERFRKLKKLYKE